MSDRDSGQVVAVRFRLACHRINFGYHDAAFVEGAIHHPDFAIGAAAHRRIDGVQGQAWLIRPNTEKAHIDPLVVGIGRVERLIGHAADGRGHGAPLRTGIVQVVLVVHVNDVGSPEISVKDVNTAHGSPFHISVDPGGKYSLGKGSRPCFPGDQVFGIHGINAIAGTKHPVRVLALDNTGWIMYTGPPILCRQGEGAEKQD